MTVRKWVIRGFLMFVTLLLGGAYYVYGQYTNPDAVAQMVLAELNQHFPGADIELGHAEWRLFGGVRLNELRVTPGDRRGQEPTAILRQTSLQIDKAQAARGKFELLKVTLEHPQLNLERDESGRWNILELLTAKPNTTGSIPFVTLHDGLIRFHDRKLDFPVLELKEVQAKLVPQPQGVLSGEGSGYSELLGPISFRFVHQPKIDSTELVLTIPTIEYKPQLEEIIVKLIPNWREQQIRVMGKMGLETKLTWLPGREVPLIQSTVKLEGGELRHPSIPVPLRNIEAQIDYTPQALVVSSLSARAEEGAVTGNARIDLAADLNQIADHQAVLRLDYQNVRLHPGIYPSLPPALNKFCADFRTTGLIDGSLDMSWKDRRLGLAYTLKPHQGEFEAEAFPYPAKSVAGQLRYDETGPVPVLQIDLRGFFGKRPFTLQGQVYGPGLRPEVALSPGLDLTIKSDEVPLDRALERALEPYPETHRALRQFHARGCFDCTVRIRRESGATPLDHPQMFRWVSAQLKDVQFRFDHFPCPIEKASAQLDIFPDKTWRLTRFVGEHQGARINGFAWLTGTTAGDVLHLEMTSKNTPFSSELFGAMPPEVQTVWKHFRPAGRAECKVVFDKLEKGKPTVDVKLTAQGMKIHPVSFPYTLDNVRGHFHFANKQVEIQSLTAQHGKTSIGLEQGHVTVRNGQGFLAQLRGITFDQLSADEDLLSALPGMLRESVATVRPTKPVNVRFNLDIDVPGESSPAKLAWSGNIELNQCGLRCGCALNDLTGIIVLDEGTYDNGKVKTVGRLFFHSMNIADKQMIGPLACNLLLTSDQLLFHECKASIPGGSLNGLIEVKLGGAPRFHLDLAAEASLAELLKKTDGPQGNARAKIVLNGEGSSLANLQGNGAISIRDAKNLCQLPLIFDIFNQFSQMLPKATNFQEAKLDFVIRGDRLVAERVQLLADAYRIEGNGSAKISGEELNLVLMFVMGGGRTFPLMPGMIDRMQTTLAKSLMKVRVNGSVDNVQVNVEPLPFIVEPVKDVFRAFGNK